MISAEHYALEDEAVRDLLVLREQEVKYYTGALNSVGVQSALICGFSVTLLACYRPGHESLDFLLYWYYISGALSVAAAMNSVISSAFASIW